jgi:alkanesulfonate monooxygenase SsuD/methylene tetrahydromethanopterin reductase-like flavin-dependent oxidoreductase (luciferase family)
MATIVMRFDFRCPPGDATPAAELYHAALEMAAYADGKGVNVIGLSEHHNTADGYLPAPLTVATAMAARTRHALISIGALLVPLYDPIKLAEDLAVLDIIARGRLTVIAGIGYRESEYHALDSDWGGRGKQLETTLDILRQAWRGEPFLYRGEEITVLPRPYSQPHPMIAVGGNSPIAARRAARLQLPFFPGIDDPSLVECYHEECRRSEFAGGFVLLPNYPATTYIAEDVEEGWREMGEFMLYDALAYGAWRHSTRRAYAESFAQDLESLREEGKYRVLTPQQAVEVIRKTGSLHLSPLVGGCPPALGWKSLKLFVEHVAPALAQSRATSNVAAPDS